MFGKKELSRIFSHNGSEIIISIEYTKNNLHDMVWAFQNSKRHPVLVPELRTVMQNVSDIRAASSIRHVRSFLDSIFELIRNSRPAICITNRKIVLIVNDNVDEVHSLAYDHERSDWNVAVLHISVEALAEYGTYHMLTKKNHPDFSRTFVHEIDHYLDRRVNRFYNNYSRVVKRFPDLSPRGIALIDLLIRMRAESYTLILEAVTEKQVLVNLYQVYWFRRYLKQIANFKGSDEDLTKLAKYVYSQGFTHEAGQYMALTLCLSECKRAGILSHCKARIDSGTVSLAGDLNAVFRKPTVVAFSDIPERMIMYTAKRIASMEYRDLIKAYERACDELGISKRYRAIWYSWFVQLKRQSTDWYAKRTRRVS